MGRRLILAAVAIVAVLAIGLGLRPEHPVRGEPRATLSPDEQTAQVPTLTAVAATQGPTLTAIALLTPTATATCTPGPQCVYLSSIVGRALPTATLLRVCDGAYPTICLPPPPPDLDCGDIPYRNFVVLPPDPHGLDRDHDGIGCENG